MGPHQRTFGDVSKPLSAEISGISNVMSKRQLSANCDMATILSHCP